MSESQRIIYEMRGLDNNDRDRTIIMETVLFHTPVELNDDVSISTEIVVYTRETKRVHCHEFHTEKFPLQKIKDTFENLKKNITKFLSQNEGNYETIKRIKQKEVHRD